MKRQRASLSELCTLIKGASPISKTQPGPYTLVTTGEKHKTADSFQFDNEAVCIPLISSTGHGHASLKRVHYQTGKFALANLLAAAFVKDRSILSTKFLARYLMFSKDRLIVPLMTGAANMSISIDRLATVPIEFPPLAQQERIVKLLDEAEELRKLRIQADRCTADLIPALFHEMFGDPLKNRLNFPVCELGSLCKVVGGGTPSKKQPAYWTGNIPWVSPKDMSGDEIHDSEDHISDQAIKESATNLIPAGSILVVTRSGILKHTLPIAINSVPVTINQDIKAFVPTDECESTFLAVHLRALAPAILGSVRVGATVQNLETETLKRLQVLNPPLPLQQEFASRITAIHELEAAQATSRQRTEHLFQSMLHRAFNQEL